MAHTNKQKKKFNRCGIIEITNFLWTLDLTMVLAPKWGAEGVALMAGRVLTRGNQKWRKTICSLVLTCFCGKWNKNTRAHLDTWYVRLSTTTVEFQWNHDSNRDAAYAVCISPAPLPHPFRTPSAPLPHPFRTLSSPFPPFETRCMEKSFAMYIWVLLWGQSDLFCMRFNVGDIHVAFLFGGIKDRVQSGKHWNSVKQKCASR